MRADSLTLEEIRLREVRQLQDYRSVHERHRVFPAIFEDRAHRRILESSAGVGCVASRIQEHYSAELVCNDISPHCLAILKQLGLNTACFDLDDEMQPFPFADGKFDAVISLATIEHLIHIDHFVQEIHRILCDDGYFYLSSPNYAALIYLPRLVLHGRSFHDPLSPTSRYEFYAHVRYFTYATLARFVSSFGFVPDTVYLPMPGGSSWYQAMYARSRAKALMFRYGMKLIYRVLSPRWAAEPIICFRKSLPNGRKLRKVLL